MAAATRDPVRLYITSYAPSDRRLPPSTATMASMSGGLITQSQKDAKVPIAWCLLSRRCWSLRIDGRQCLHLPLESKRRMTTVFPSNSRLFKETAGLRTSRLV